MHEQESDQQGQERNTHRSRASLLTDSSGVWLPHHPRPIRRKQMCTLHQIPKFLRGLNCSPHKENASAPCLPVLKLCRNMKINHLYLNLCLKVYFLENVNQGNAHIFIGPLRFILFTKRLSRNYYHFSNDGIKTPKVEQLEIRSLLKGLPGVVEFQCGVLPWLIPSLDKSHILIYGYVHTGNIPKAANTFSKILHVKTVTFAFEQPSIGSQVLSAATNSPVAGEPAYENEYRQPLLLKT